MSKSRFTVKVLEHHIIAPPDERHCYDNDPLPHWDFEGLIEKFINQKLEELEIEDNDTFNWEFKQINGKYVYFQGEIESTSQPNISSLAS